MANMEERVTKLEQIMSDHITSDKITKSEYNQMFLDIMGQIQSIDVDPIITVNTNGNQKDITLSEATKQSYNRTAFLDEYSKKDLKNAVDAGMIVISDVHTFKRWSPVLKKIGIGFMLLLSGGSIASIAKAIFF